MSKAYEQLKTYLERAQAFQTAMILFEWDNETLAPKEAGPYTSRMIGAISGEYYRVITDEEFKQLIETCKKDDSLSETEAAIVREAAEELKQLDCILWQEYSPAA